MKPILIFLAFLTTCTPEFEIPEYEIPDDFATGEYLVDGGPESVIFAPAGVATELHPGIFVYPAHDRAYVKTEYSDHKRKIVCQGSVDLSGDEISLNWKERPPQEFVIHSLGHDLFKMDGPDEYFELWQKMD